MTYSAFISYSHDVDTQLAKALRSAVQSFAKPWYRLRAVRVFQDSSSLALDPSLWGSVRQALDDSDYLILLASPQSAKSEWVNKEVEHWLESHDLDTVLLVLTHGDIRWDPARGTFDPETTDALPPALKNAYSNEPLYLDLRWAKNAELTSLRDPRFRDAVAGLQAVLRNQPKDQLVGEDVRNHRNARRLAWSGGTLVVLLAIAASVAALLANQQRREAERQRDTANARLLGVQAEQLLDQNPELLSRSALLAIEALRNGAGPQAEQALRDSVVLMPRLVTEIDVAATLRRANTLAFDPRGGRIAIGGDWGLGLWDTTNGELLRSVEGDSEKSIVFAAREPYLWALSRDNIVRLSLDDLETSQTLPRSPSSRGLLGGGDPGWFAWPERDGSVRVEPLRTDGKRIELQPAGGPRDSDRVQTLAFNKDGTRLAAIGAAQEIHVWSLPSGTLTRTIAGPADRSYGGQALALSPAGDRLAAARGDTMVELWELDAKTPPTRIDHGSGIVHVRFAPDGSTIATAGNGSVRLWDSAGRERSRIPYDEDVEFLGFAADGKLLAVAEKDGPVRIWDLAADRAGMAAVPTEGVNAVALSPDSRYLATGEDAGLARVWDLETGQETQRLMHPPAVFENLISRVVFSPDESRLTATSNAGETVIWRLNDGTEVARLSTPELGWSSRLGPEGSLIAGLAGIHSTEVWNIERGERVVRIDHGGSDWPLISPGRRFVAVKRKSEVFVYSLSGKQVSHFEIDPKLEIKAVVFSPDARHVAAGGEDERVTVRDVERDADVVQLPHEAVISDLAFAADGKHLVTSTATGVVRVFEVESWQEILRQAHPAPVVDMAIGATRVTTADEQRDIRVWEIPSGRLLREVQFPDEVRLVSVRPGSDILGIAGRRTLAGISIATGETELKQRFLAEVTTFRQSPSGRNLAVGLSDGGTQVWDLSTRKQVLDIRGQGAAGDVEQVDFSSDGSRLITVADHAHVWDLSTGSEIMRVPTGSFGGVAALSADGAFLALGGSSSDLTVWDVATEEPVMTDQHDTMIHSVAFSPDGSLVAATGFPSTVARVWRVADGDLVRTITVDASGGLLRLAFHPDGKRIMTAGRNGSVRFWSLEDGVEVNRLLQGNPVLGLEVTTDGRFLATTSADYVARVWSLERNELVNLVPHGVATRSLALSTDGKLLATVDANQRLSLWHLDRERLLADACDRVSRNLSWGEWQQYLGDARYRKTCENRPLHGSFVQAAFEMAQNGDPRGARAQLVHARELEPAWDLDIDEELTHMAQRLDLQGVSLAEKVEIARAARRFEAANLLAQEGPYDYEQRARFVAINEKLETALDQVRDGKAEEALATVDKAIAIDPAVEIPASVWNSLCWYGTVYGDAPKVLDACNTAVTRAGHELNGFMADSRGVARIVVGDTEGAIADFETFVAWAADKPAFSELATARQEWAEALDRGANPLDGMNLVEYSNYMAGYRMELGLPYQLVNLD